MTLDDIKKQLLDINEIQSVQVNSVTEGKRKLYFNNSTNRVQESSTVDELEINGLYEIMLEHEEENSSNILEEVRSILRRDRNLCQDLVDVYSIRSRSIAIHATVILSLESNVNETLAEIYFRIYKFLNPKKLFTHESNFKKKKNL